MRRRFEGGTMAARAISPLSGGREESACACGQTPPVHNVLRLKLRDLLGILADRGREVLAVRAAARRPHRGSPHPGVGGAAGPWFPDNPLACEVVLVRPGYRTSASRPRGQPGAQRRSWCSLALAGPVQPRVRRPRGLRGAPGQPRRRAAGGGTRLARIRAASPAGRPLPAPGHPYPRRARNHLACAYLHLGSGLAAVLHPGRRPGDACGDVLVRVVVQPHRRQRAHDPDCARHRREHPGGALWPGGAAARLILLYAAVWCVVAIALIVLDWRFWRGPAPAPTMVQLAYEGE